MVARMKNTEDKADLRNPTASELPGLLAELDESGLGVAAFARDRGLKPHNIYIARRRLRSSGSAATIFDPVRFAGAIASGSTFELELRAGHRLLIPTDFDPSSLRRLLEVLAAC